MTRITAKGTTLVHVAAGIIWRDGLYLAAQRPKYAMHGGFWEFPGGKIDAGETTEQALCRELHEELGITALRYRLWKSVTHSYPERCVLLHMFHVTDFSGVPQPKEGQVLRFVSPQDGMGLAFLQADVPLVQALATRTYV